MADPSIRGRHEPCRNARSVSERAISPAVRAWGAATVLIVAALGSTLLWQPRPLLLWNASSSGTIGLYAVTPPAAPQAGDLVVAWAPPSARAMAAARTYLPFDVPLVKPVAAAAGDRVCARAGRIFINGRAVALRRARDPSTRLMPWWSGCRRLGRGELFLLSPVGPLAFDGRYFGVIGPSQLIGKAHLLWAKSAKGSSDG